MTLLKVTFNELRDFRNGKNPQPGPSAPDRVAGGGGGLGFGLFKPLLLKSGSARKFNQGNAEAGRDGPPFFWTLSPFGVPRAWGRASSCGLAFLRRRARPVVVVFPSAVFFRPRPNPSRRAGTYSPDFSGVIEFK